MTTKNGSPSYFFSESKLRNRYHNFAILSLMYFSVWGIFKTYIYININININIQTITSAERWLPMVDHQSSLFPDSILPSDQCWLVVAWSADFANIGQT